MTGVTAVPAAARPSPSAHRDAVGRLCPLLHSALPAALCLLRCVAAAAQTASDEVLEQGGLSPAVTPGHWNVTLGAGLALAPRYLGARDDRVVGAPLISASYGRFFLGPFGIAYVAAHADNWYIGPLVGYIPGRPQDADAHLEGLGDIPSSAAAGAFGLYHAGHFVVTAALEQAVSHTGNGLVGLAQVSYQAVLVPRILDLSIGPVIQLADRAHEQTFFGVTPAQSVQSGLAQFSPGAGVTDVGVQVNFTYHYSRHVLLRVFANAKELTGGVADSPIVERRLQTLTGAGFAYRF